MVKILNTYWNFLKQNCLSSFQNTFEPFPRPSYQTKSAISMRKHNDRNKITYLYWGVLNLLYSKNKHPS